MESRYKIAWAYAAGESHELAGIPCQDRICVQRKNGAECAVLADGAGSVENSQYISSAVTRVLAEDFCTCADYWLAMNDTQLKAYVRELSSRAAGMYPGMAADCTLLFFGAYEDQILILHIGDGIILGTGEEAEAISLPEHGAEPNQTYFLSGPEMENHLRIYREIMEDTDTVVMTSDGLERVLYDPVMHIPANAVKIMRQWITENEEDTVSQKLAETFRELFRKYTTDDLSILVIHRINTE